MKKFLLLFLICFSLPASALAAGGTLGSSNNTATLTSGLVGYWSLDGNKTNWLTGVTTDSSGQGNNGSLVSMSTTTSPTPGKIGQALKFNGTNQDILASNSQPNYTEYAICAWIKPNFSSGSNTAGTIFVRSNGAASIYGMRIAWANASYGWYSDNVKVGGGGAYATQGNTVPFSAGQWHHICFSYKVATGGQYWWDGKAVTTNMPFTAWASANLANLPFTIGSDGNAANFFNGSIDDVRAYNRALSVQEVVQLYTTGLATVDHSNTTTLQTGLVGYWPFDGNTTNWNIDATIDASGNGNLGYLIGMSTTTSPVAGKIGGALNFNGSAAQWVALGSPASLEGLQLPLTISGWFKQTSTSGLQPIYAAYLNAAISGQLWSLVRIDNGTFKYYASAASGVYQSAGTFTPAVGKWHYFSIVVTGTVSSPTLAIYLDGASQGFSLAAMATSLTSIPIVIGGDSAQANERFNGTIDDLRVYNRALSSKEAQQLYTNGQVNIAHSNTTTLQTGLVGYWTFDGPNTNWKTDTVADSSGQGNTGQMISMATSSSPTAGKIGQALKFNGSTSYVGVPDAASLDPTAITVSAWVKFNAFTNAYNAIVQKGNTINSYYEYFVKSNGKLAIYMAASSAAPVYDGTGTYTLSTGVWYHVVMTYNSTAGLRGYVNGQLDGTVAASGTLNATTGYPFAIGTDLATAGRYSNATIDDVHIYNRALSAQEVQLLYSSGR